MAIKIAKTYRKKLKILRKQKPKEKENISALLKAVIRFCRVRYDSALTCTTIMVHSPSSAYTLAVIKSLARNKTSRLIPASTVEIDLLSVNIARRASIQRAICWTMSVVIRVISKST